MSKIEICRQHALSPEEREAALSELTTYLIGMGASVSRDDEELACRGKGYEGVLRIGPGELSGVMSLGLLARPFRRQLEDAINTEISKRLGSPD